MFKIGDKVKLIETGEVGIVCDIDHDDLGRFTGYKVCFSPPNKMPRDEDEYMWCDEDELELVQDSNNKKEEKACKFKVGDKVKVVVNDEVGTVVGVSQHSKDLIRVEVKDYLGVYEQYELELVKEVEEQPHKFKIGDQVVCKNTLSKGTIESTCEDHSDYYLVRGRNGIASFRFGDEITLDKTENPKEILFSEAEIEKAYEDLDLWYGDLLVQQLKKNKELSQDPEYAKYLELKAKYED